MKGTKIPVWKWINQSFDAWNEVSHVSLQTFTPRCSLNNINLSIKLQLTRLFKNQENRPESEFIYPGVHKPLTDFNFFFFLSKLRFSECFYLVIFFCLTLNTPGKWKKLSWKRFWLNEVSLRWLLYKKILRRTFLKYESSVQVFHLFIANYKVLEYEK